MFFSNRLTAEYTYKGVNLIGKSIEMAMESFVIARQQVEKSLSEKGVDKNTQRCMDIMFSSSWPTEEKTASLGTCSYPIPVIKKITEAERMASILKVNESVPLPAIVSGYTNQMV